MTDETPGTSLTDDRFAQHIWKIAYDAMRREGATEDHAMAWADVLRIEVEKRARERRERVDPDLDGRRTSAGRYWIEQTKALTEPPDLLNLVATVEAIIAQVEDEAFRERVDPDPDYTLHVDPAHVARIEELIAELTRLLGVDIGEWSRLYRAGGTTDGIDTGPDRNSEHGSEEDQRDVLVREVPRGERREGIAPAGEPDARDESRPPDDVNRRSPGARVDPDPEWHKANSALPSMRCVCGHWDTEHAAFVSKVRPGRTRTFCDHCDCRSWMTPEDERAMNAARSRATDLLEATK